MKTLILIISLIFVASYSRAQFSGATVVAGANYSNFFPDQQGYETLSRSSKPGYQIGILADINKNKLSIETGLLFEQFESSENYQESSPSGNAAGTINYHVHYVQLPLLFLYNTNVSFGKLFMGGGPYLAAGIDGSMKYTATYYSIFGGTVTSTETDKFEFSQYYASPDYGIKIKIGAAIKSGFQMIFSVDHGIGYLLNGKDIYHTDLGLKNDVFSLSLGYSIF